MSIISDIGPKNENLPNVLGKYEDALQGYENNLTLRGKTLEFALKEQATWSAFYLERKVELKTLVTYLETQVKKVRANIYVEYNEHYNPQLSDRAIEKYIDRESEYLMIYELYSEAVEVYNKYDMLVEAFNRRGFALRDITASKIAEVNDYVL